MGQLLEDSKLLIKTDKRIWAVCGFILVVLVVWALTDSWRPLPEVPEEKFVTIREEPTRNAGFLLQGLSEGLGEVNKQNEILQNDLNRISRNIESKQEEIHWQLDKLVNRLGSMNDTIDSITRKVGDRNVQEAYKDDLSEKRSDKRR